MPARGLLSGWGLNIDGHQRLRLGDARDLSGRGRLPSCNRGTRVIGVTCYIGVTCNIVPEVIWFQFRLTCHFFPEVIRFELGLTCHFVSQIF